MKPSVSVVIPSFNRADAIGMTLDHLAGQRLSLGGFEVIIVDDGSTDCTEEIVNTKTWPFDLTFIRQVNLGPASARNRGIARATADLIMFLDSDVFATEGFLEQHLHSHSEVQNQLIIGRIQPWPNMVRPWYEYTVNPEGVGRDYGETAKSLPFYYAYSCNLSVKRVEIERIGGFDESLRAFEDVEFAYRADVLGIKLSYRPQCLGFHYHSLPLVERCNKELEYASSLASLILKHPPLQNTFPGISELMPASLLTISPRRSARRALFSFLSLAPTRLLLYRALIWLDRQQICSRIAARLYWWLIFGLRSHGFREGLRLYR